MFTSLAYEGFPPKTLFVCAVQLNKCFLKVAALYLIIVNPEMVKKTQKNRLIKNSRLEKFYSNDCKAF